MDVSIDAGVFMETYRHTDTQTKHMAKTYIWKIEMANCSFIGVIVSMEHLKGIAALVVIANRQIYLFSFIVRNETLKTNTLLTLDPNISGVFNGPYPFGIDPVSIYNHM